MQPDARLLFQKQGNKRIGQPRFLNTQEQNNDINKKKFADINRLCNVVYTPHPNTITDMKKSNAKKRGLDRENKDVTCAVRLPESMYSRLYQLAKSEGSSLSDIIREALVIKMDDMEEVIMERKLKKARYEAEMAKLSSAS